MPGFLTRCCLPRPASDPAEIRLTLGQERLNALDFLGGPEHLVAGLLRPPDPLLLRDFEREVDDALAQLESVARAGLQDRCQVVCRPQAPAAGYDAVDQPPVQRRPRVDRLAEKHQLPGGGVTHAAGAAKGG